jgi:Carboxypeptidase regulatory-like domain
MRWSMAAVAAAAILSAACHPGPIASKPEIVGGTIAGIVKTSDSTVAVPGRRVSAVEVKTGTRGDTTTGADGGYTVQVPIGTYRLELELAGSEILAKQPSPTHVNNGDLDPGRDFVIIQRAPNQ